MEKFKSIKKETSSILTIDYRILCQQMKGVNKLNNYKKQKGKGGDRSGLSCKSDFLEWCRNVLEALFKETILRHNHKDAKKRLVGSALENTEHVGTVD